MSSSELSDMQPVKPIVDWHNSEPFLATSVKWRDATVQVLCSQELNITALLGSFDWNVSLFGYDGDRVHQLEDIGNIAPNKELRLHRVTFPLSTLRRGFRFSERFKMRLKREDVVSLSRDIVARAERNVPDDGPGLEEES